VKLLNSFPLSTGLVIGGKTALLVVEVGVSVFMDAVGGGFGKSLPQYRQTIA